MKDQLLKNHLPQNIVKNKDQGTTVMIFALNQEISSNINDSGVVVAEVVGETRGTPKNMLQKLDNHNAIIQDIEIAPSVPRKMTSFVLLTNTDGKCFRKLYFIRLGMQLIIFHFQTISGDLLVNTKNQLFLQKR